MRRRPLTENTFPSPPYVPLVFKVVRFNDPALREIKVSKLRPLRGRSFAPALRPHSRRLCSRCVYQGGLGCHSYFLRNPANLQGNVYRRLLSDNQVDAGDRLRRKARLCLFLRCTRPQATRATYRAQRSSGGLPFWFCLCFSVRRCYLGIRHSRTRCIHRPARLSRPSLGSLHFIPAHASTTPTTINHSLTHPVFFILIHPSVSDLTYWTCPVSPVRIASPLLILFIFLKSTMPWLVIWLIDYTSLIAHLCPRLSHGFQARNGRVNLGRCHSILTTRH